MVNTTEQLLIKHFQTYPNLQAEDIFKYLYQSAFGCEHLLSNEDAALSYIKSEYASVSKTAEALTEPLDGEYSRVQLSYLNNGLTPETLTKLFCLSAKTETDGKFSLEKKLQAAKSLISEGVLPIDSGDFEKKLELWRAND